MPPIPVSYSPQLRGIIRAMMSLNVRVVARTKSRRADCSPDQGLARNSCSICLRCNYTRRHSPYRTSGLSNASHQPS